MSFADVPIELVIVPESTGDTFRVEWLDCTAVSPVFLRHIPDVWLDLVPFMAARILLMHGCDAERPYTVRLQGADYEMMRTDLGSAAAPPLISTTPVKEAARCIYWLDPARRRFFDRRRKAAP